MKMRMKMNKKKKRRRKRRKKEKLFILKQYKIESNLLEVEHALFL